MYLTTATEINNDYFTVERSKEGENFEFVANVKGAGNSNEKRNYKTQDANPYYGVSYYRLKQTDFDGKHEYFGPVAVNITVKPEISIFPNPVKNEMVISISGLGNADADIKIYDIMGRTVYFKEFTGNFTGFIMNAHQFSAGMYYISVSYGDLMESVKFVKE